MWFSLIFSIKLFSSAILTILKSPVLRSRIEELARMNKTFSNALEQIKVHITKKKNNHKNLQVPFKL